MGTEVKEPLVIPVRKICKAFDYAILQFQTRRVDKDLSFEEWEHLYTSLLVEANGVKDGMEVVMTAVESFDCWRTLLMELIGGDYPNLRLSGGWRSKYTLLLVIYY